jgi:hypothetical protein
MLEHIPVVYRLLVFILITNILHSMKWVEEVAMVGYSAIFPISLETA